MNDRSDIANCEPIGEAVASRHAFRVLAERHVPYLDTLLDPQLHKPMKRFYFRLFIKLSTKMADRIILVSQSTLNDLKTYFKDEKIYAIIKTMTIRIVYN